MIGFAQPAFSAKTIIVCFGLLSSQDPGSSSSGILAFLMMLLLFVVFLVPFDRRLLDRYARWVGAKASAQERTRSGKRKSVNGFPETALAGGPYTRRLCKMLDLEVVARRARFRLVRSRPARLAIGRWNESSREFELVTPWCKTWGDLEQEARHAIRSFREITRPKSRGASNV